MVKIQVNSQGKAYITSGGKALLSSGGGGGDTISAINNTGEAITSGDKVFIAPLTTPQSGANYEIIKPKTTDSIGLGGYTRGSVALNLTNKYANNFGYDNYLEIPKVFDFSHPWEFQICFQTPSYIDSGWIVIFAGGSNVYENSGLIVQLYQGKITVIVTYGDSNDRIVDLNNYEVSANTTYYVKVIWTGTQYIVKYSTDGSMWVDDVDSPITSSVQPVQNSSSMRIGNFNNDSYFSDGSVYIDKTYFISNGELVWQAMYDGTWTNIDKDVVTGIATESIASGSVGEVTTLLGE
jgi:hypothetical protein